MCVYSTDSTRLFSKYDRMSSLVKRMLPPTFTNEMCLPCCRRRTPVAEIFNISATSAMVSSSMGEAESADICVKEQYRVGKYKRRRTVPLYHHRRQSVESSCYNWEEFVLGFSQRAIFQGIALGEHAAWTGSAVDPRL